MARDTRKCIKDFVRHVDALEAEEDPEGNGFHREYRLIHEIQVKNRRDNVFEMTAGKADNNLKKNRYKDILPYDEHRVMLSLVEGEENSDYINASRLMGVKGTGGYIASQGPLASTVDDFWRMIWECNVEIVFMACKIVELGKIKCKQYWHDVDKSDDFGDITVLTESEEEISSDFIQRKFRVTRAGEERHVTQFHYLGWPDHGIPDNPAHIRDLISITRQTRQNDQAPLLVHCSAGCGRTGAIVAIDFVWTLLEQGRFDETFSLYDLICNFREQRMSMVQTSDQYALVNQVLRTLCEEWLDKMASHTYVNVELKDGSSSLYENTVIKETSSRPEVSPSTAQERLAGLAPDTGPGPEIIDLPPPSYMAPKPPTPSNQSSSSYENVVILPDRTPVLKGAEAAAGEDSKPPAPQQQLHRTVIQLGSATTAASRATKSSAEGGSGGPVDVVNLVRGDSTRSSTSSTSSGKAATPAAPVVISPVSPVAPIPLGSLNLQQPHQQQPPHSPGRGGAPPDNFAIYATVNKGARTAYGNGSSAQTKPAHTANQATEGVYSLAAPAAASMSGPVGSAAASTVHGLALSPVAPSPSGILPTSPGFRTPGGQVSNGPQGLEFGERLPRVTGPVPAPDSWRDEQ